LKVADQREVEALFSNSRPAQADYGKNSGCPHMQFTDIHYRHAPFVASIKLKY
jgi:hypothetical protein